MPSSGSVPRTSRIQDTTSRHAYRLMVFPPEPLPTTWRGGGKGPLSATQPIPCGSLPFTWLLRKPSGHGLTSGRGTGAIVKDLAEFEDPPVIEVALTAQFRTLPGLRGVMLA